jgi:hypothetical protein
MELGQRKENHEKGLEVHQKKYFLWNSSILPPEKYHPLSKAVPFPFRSSAIVPHMAVLSSSLPVLFIL